MRRMLEWFTARLPRRIVKDKSENGIYLVRYYLFQSAPIELALHHIHRFDSELRLHNHPWRWAFSLVLAGGYVEERLRDGKVVVRRVLRAGQINAIGMNTFHRVSELLSEDVWTFFVHGRRNKEWYFKDSTIAEEPARLE